MEYWMNNEGRPPADDPWVKVQYKSGWEATSRSSHLIWNPSAKDPILRYALIDGPHEYKQVYRLPSQEVLL